MPETDHRSQTDAAYEAERLYRGLGSRAAINAAGAYTVLGGSILSPTVRAAMDAASYRFADMQELLASSGRIVAQLLDAEAAYVTSGAAAALTLAAAACLTRNHHDYLERLPDTAGIPNQITVQRNSRQKYDRCLTIPGAKLVEVGDEGGLTPQQLREAIGPDTAAVFYLAPGVAPGTPPLEAVIEAAHERGVPVIVDAAGLTYPVDNLRKYARLGADLVCYAGKYFDAPQSTGLLVGRAGLIEAATINGFVGFESSGYHTIGRPMKLDRQEVAGCVVALREWLEMDHEARFATYGERIEVILRAVDGLPGVEAYRTSEHEMPTPQARDGVRLRLNGANPTPDQVEQALREGEPAIHVRADAGSLAISVAFLQDGDEAIVARRLREVLGAASGA